MTLSYCVKTAICTHLCPRRRSLLSVNRDPWTDTRCRLCNGRRCVVYYTPKVPCDCWIRLRPNFTRTLYWPNQTKYRSQYHPKCNCQEHLRILRKFNHCQCRSQPIKQVYCNACHAHSKLPLSHYLRASCGKWLVYTLLWREKKEKGKGCSLKTSLKFI